MSPAAALQAPADLRPANRRAELGRERTKGDTALLAGNILKDNLEHLDIGPAHTRALLDRAGFDPRVTAPLIASMQSYGGSATAEGTLAHA